jgi:hypothetical protein
MMSSNDAKKGGGANRAARLEAQLRANLKKRKEQARARTRAASDDAGKGNGGSE